MACHLFVIVGCHLCHLVSAVCACLLSLNNYQMTRAMGFSISVDFQLLPFLVRADTSVVIPSELLTTALCSPIEISLSCRLGLD